MSKGQSCQFAEYRSAMYALAAEAFAEEPSNARLVQIVELAASSNPDDCIRTSECDLLVRIAGYGERDFDSLGASIRTEYAELFIGPRRPLAPYYESAYVGHPRRMFTQTTKDVRLFYARCGVEVEKRNAVPDDIMAYELAFMSELSRREAREWADGDFASAAALRGVQLRFLTEHLGNWTGLFAEKVESAWCADWYLAWARFLRDFVSEDVAYLEKSAFNLDDSIRI